MSGKNWVLRGVDAEARQAALAEAERRGQTLSDYLTEVLLSTALAEQAPDQPVAESEADAEAAPRGGRENFAFRHRVEALERRLTSSLSGLGSALQTLDDTVVTLTAQLDGTGDLAEDGAAALLDLAGTVDALRARLTEVETTAEAVIENNEDAHEGLASRCAELEAHLTSVETIAYAADAAAARLGDAQEALKRALADDFITFAAETDHRLDRASRDMRALAEDAAAQADAAAQRAIDALRLSREAMEKNLNDQAAQTRAAVHGAFAEAAERIDAVAERVLENQRTALRMGEQINARINLLEDSNHTAIEDAAEALRQADETLAADLGAFAEQSRAIAASLAAQQQNTAEHVKSLNSALHTTLTDMDALRDEAAACLSDAETVIEARHTALEQDMRARLDALVVRLDHAADATSEGMRVNAANIERVEACTFAALEKLARDIAEGDAQTGARLGADIAKTHAQHAALLNRVAVIDHTLGAHEHAAEALRARLAKLESAAEADTTQAALAALAKDVGDLAEKARDDETMAQLAALRTRVEAQDGLISDSAERAHGVGRMLSRVNAQNVDMLTQAEARIQRLENTLAETREDTATHDLAQSIAARVAALEESQSAALEALRADIAGFVDTYSERLDALEQSAAASLDDESDLMAQAIESRLSELETRDVAGDFDALRRRIEDRIMGVERSSVRALEQMADTIALIEKRYAEGADDTADQAALGARSA